MTALTAPPRKGTVIWLPASPGYADRDKWEGLPIDHHLLTEGLVFLTKAEAEAYLPDPVKATAAYLQRQQDNLAFHTAKQLEHERKAAACRYRLEAIEYFEAGGIRMSFNALFEAVDLETPS